MMALSADELLGMVQLCGKKETVSAMRSEANFVT
jgi:hypothetical protein